MKSYLLFIFSLLLVYNSFAQESKLIKAIKKNKPTQVEKAIKKGEDVNLLTPDGDTPLLVAASIGNSDIVNLLINHGAILDYKDKYGRRAITIAGSQGKFEIVKILSNNGADLHAIAEEGSNVIWSTANAISSRYVKNVSSYGSSTVSLDVYEEIIRFFLSEGVNPNAKNTKGKTSLMLIVEWCSPALIKDFVDKGTDAKAKDKNGKTALHYLALGQMYTFEKSKLLTSQDPMGSALLQAMDKEPVTKEDLEKVEKNYVNILNILIEAGLDPNEKDNNGKTALDVAEEIGKTYHQSEKLLSALRELTK